MTREAFLKNELENCAKTIAFVTENWKDDNDDSYNTFLVDQLKVCRTNIMRNLSELYLGDG